MASDASRGESLERQQSLPTLPSKLTLDYLKKITNDFSPDRELGHSAFGTYYKGIRGNGDILAVKKLAENSPLPREKTFVNEVTNLMALQHENITELVSFCREAQIKLDQREGRYVAVHIDESLLCYKYLSKGSLDLHLFDETHNKIDWDKRFKIIKGICQGLRFLHKELDRPLVHMNLVPSSIWLDDNWVPKIADFGLSRLFGEQTQVYTKNVVGQNGYMAPEYLFNGEITTGLDIYSLGMIILEIVTGERNGANREDRAATKFVDKVRQDWKTDDDITCKYPSLTDFGLEQVKACIVIALKCLEADQNKRPSIEDIIDKLNGKFVPIFQQHE
ncbi:hypothetical protein GQ55_8G079100 [Panicum hallii var. hallii]|uniref:Protein kinase domain-containing protein n=1 Tax=Panicum hallii var. hallii TaxID=1504633 RepID=A0A2T7CLY1_9POAL|nr:hypothetical protein GQ55_8G079100 [Panicum hallii var. hallii]